MLNWLRGRISGLQGSLGRAASSLMPNPSAWTAVGFLLSIFAGVAYWAGPPWAGGILLLASGFIDIVDGAVARSTGRVSSAGAFLDSTLDRFAEVAAYAGIAASSHVPSVIVLLALALSLTVSYLRARFESLSNERPRGLELGERAERLLALGILSLLGSLEVGVLLVLALALETNIERFVLYRRVLSGRTSSMAGNS
ncbi:CDP-alcohol phosphatidyltransferase family protein [Conexivisphaera calida]|uniref:CDP-diacylglycerol--glycerol-3-phosphate 3-phosphatidyltransferase n=1 Tax=Conexivisphaera calida TaxID=1874277 RepID=A0A4P2VH00_9ARCH|nr:CDP-alcohol phosphatidyltransferase family protein [Conexivisphaera calida]BBE42522.1 CDP-diacylglycerol--glycerol-3-phosphate 3-phosphatidyltransferase [Conexivisphaera calida]